MFKIFLLLVSLFLEISVYSLEIKDNKIYDKFGNNIEIKKYERIIIVDPATIETMFMLGEGENIVGIGRSENTIIEPVEKINKIQSIGTALKPSFEKIVVLKPDLVILNNNSSGITDNLRKLKIPFFINDSTKELNLILESIKIYSKLIDKEKEGEVLYNQYLNKILKIEREKNKLKNLKGAIIYATSPLTSFSDKYLPGKVLKFLGVKNVTEDSIGNMPIISYEHILESDLDFILLPKSIGSVENFLRANPVLRKTKVAKRNNIFIVDSINFLRGSPKIFDTIESVFLELQNIK